MHQAILDLYGYASIARHQYAQGAPYSRLFRNAVTGSYDSYRAPRGVNPGIDINDPGDDQRLSLPSSNRLSVQARLSLQRLLGVDGQVYLDIMNLPISRELP